MKAQRPFRLLLPAIAIMVGGATAGRCLRRISRPPSPACLVLLMPLGGTNPAVALSLSEQTPAAGLSLALEALSLQSSRRPLLLEVHLTATGPRALQYETAGASHALLGDQVAVSVTNAWGVIRQQVAWNGHYAATGVELLLPGRSLTTLILSPALSPGIYQVRVLVQPASKRDPAQAPPAPSPPISIEIKDEAVLESGYDAQELTGVRAGDPLWTTIVSCSGWPLALRDRYLSPFFGTVTVCAAPVLQALLGDLGSADPQSCARALAALRDYQPPLPGMALALDRAFSRQAYLLAEPAAVGEQIYLDLIRLSDGAGAVETLLRQSRDPLPEHAIWVLLHLSSRCTEPRVAAMMRAFLTVEDRNIREAAMAALAPTRDPALLEGLLDAALIHDATAPTKDFIFQALTWYDDPRASATIERMSHGSVSHDAAGAVLAQRAQWPLPIPPP